MQTFLPYASFVQSARCLDGKRLNKQRVECYQILKAITDPEYGWQHHPAVNQWRGHIGALSQYSLEMHWECNHRRVADNQGWTSRFCEYLRMDLEAELPAWIGDARFHDSHKSNLIRKDEEFYGPIWPDMPANLPYFWPSKEVDYA